MNAIAKNFKDGLLSMLPSQESYNDFKQKAENSNLAIQKLYQYAYSIGLIKEENENALLNFIKEYAFEEDPESELDGRTFKEIVMEVTKRSSTNKPLTVNTWIETCLNPIAQELFGTEIKQSMITRLQQEFHIKTPKQQTVLRVVAYWIAANRPQLHWNYQKFAKLSEDTSVKTSLSKIDEGATIAFSIQGRSGIVEQKTIDWIKTELFKCIEFLKLPNDYVKKEKVTSLSVTSVSLTIPKQPGPIYEPELYTKAIQASVVISHQMAVRWLLSDPSKQQGIMVIAIYAGLFSDAIFALQAIFDEQFSGETHILLNDFAYQCARVADLKVVFRNQPGNIALRKKEYLKVWTIDYFWLYPYFNFILQISEILLNDKNVEQIEQYFHYKTKNMQEPPSIIEVIQKYPHNPLILIEIAKSLLSRKKYYLADKVLTDILVLYPRHIIARIARMIIYEKIASQKFSDLATTEFAFERAIAEGKLIPTDCDDPVVWCEMGLVYYAWALHYFRFGEQSDYKEKERLKQKILTALKNSREQFLKGISLSSDGKDIRSIALFIRTQALLELVTQTHDLPEGAFSEDNYSMYYDTMIRFAKLIGLLPADFSKENIFEKLTFDKHQRKVYIRFIMRILEMNNKYQESVFFKSFTPNTYYFFGCFLWDYMPVLTKELCYMIYLLFQQAKNMAEKLREKDITVCVSSNIYPQEPKVFIELIDESIQKMEQAIPQEMLTAKKLWETGDLKEGFEISENNIQFLNQDAMEKVSKIKLTLLEIEFIKK